MAIKVFTIEYISSCLITPNIKHMTFKTINNEMFEFIPGQFITFIFDKENQRRSYSITNIKNHSSIIEIVISYMNGGTASERLFNNIKTGEKFKVIGPAGKFTLLKCNKNVRNLILAATSTGIAPYRSMLPQLEKYILEKKIKNIYVLLGVTNKNNILFAEDFNKYKNHYKNFYFQICFSRQNKNLKNDEISGYVQDQFEKLNLNSKYDIIYLCGNPNMVNSAYKKLTYLGFTKSSINKEKYILSKK